MPLVSPVSSRLSVLSTSGLASISAVIMTVSDLGKDKMSVQKVLTALGRRAC